MTEEELIARLEALHGDDVDAERNHGEADRLLLEFIGSERVTAAFKEIKRWYA